MDGQGFEDHVSLSSVCVAGLGTQVSRLAGVTAGWRLTSTSTLWRSSVDLAQIAQEFPKRLCVIGGQSGRARDAPVIAAGLLLDAAGWEPLPSIPTSRLDCAAAAFAGNVYVIGGRLSGSSAALGTVEQVNLGTRQWSSAPCLMVPRVCCAAAVLGGVVFAVGGCGDSEVETLASVEGMASGQCWNPVGGLPTSRFRCAAATAQGSLYVFGGMNSVCRCLDTAERYGLGEWQQLPPMRTRRASCVAASVCDALLVAGGFADWTTHDTVERLDLVTNMWEEVAHMRYPRRDFAAAVVGTVLVLGGTSFGKLTSSVERWDGKSWEAVAPLPCARRGCVAAATWC